MSAKPPQTCPNCHEEIDPLVCYCGEEIVEGSYHDNHYPVPAGCKCTMNEFVDEALIDDTPLEGDPT